MVQSHAPQSLNGTDLDAYEDLLGPEGLSSLQITLDGTPAEHDKRRVYPDGQGSFDRIARNITLALDRGVGIQVRLNVDRRNIGQLPQLAQIFVDKGWHERPRFNAYAAVISAVNDRTERATTFSSWQLDQELERLHSDNPIMKVIQPKDSDIRERAKSIFTGAGVKLHATFCSAHSGMYVIDSFGHLYACWERTGNPNIRIGAIKPDSSVEINEPFAGMWRGRSVTSNPICRQCRYALYCGGGCAVRAESRKGTMDANYCDGYAFRFRSMVAEAYKEHVQEALPSGSGTNSDAGVTKG